MSYGIFIVHQRKGDMIMLFYQFTGKLKGAPQVADPREARQERRAKAAMIKVKTEQYAESRKDGAFPFVSGISEEEVVCGAILTDKLDIENIAADFFGTVGPEAEYVSSHEITYQSFRELLTAAEREGLISDDYAVLDRFGISDLNRFDHRRIPFSEGMIDAEADPEALYDEARKHLAGETLSPELDRIFASEKQEKLVGHPVHYLIESDDDQFSKRIMHTLLSALYAKGRILSRRYAEFDTGSDRIRNDVVRSVYEACSGGTVVITLSDPFCEDGDELEAFGEDAFDTICDAAMEYSNRVLFIFRLPRECTAIKKRIAEFMGDLSFVEITEDIVNGEKARKYLEALAKDCPVPADETLFSLISEEKTYYGSELRKVYENWFNVKLKTDLFPQYACVSECRAKTVKEEGKGSAYKELTSMIGLTGVKSVIEKALNFYKLQRIYKERGISQTRPAMHMVFTGNPGTAKTTVARLFSRIMKENELLSRGHLVEVGRGDLVGQFVGWTAKTVEEKFRQADCGVLFIDEAYSLVDDRDGCFGDEAINTIVQQMENRRDSMIVIFAGYPDKMESFLDKNPGLRSRIAFHVDFPDYSVDELCDIAKHVGKSKGLKLSEDAISKLSEVFEAARLSPDFGNGRYVRNIIEHKEMNMAGRLLSIEPETMTAEALTTITAEDVDMPERKPVKREKRIGFGW
jgi:hypothetical protein